MIERQKGDIYFQCDSCNEATEPLTSDFATAWNIAKRDGWRARKVGTEWGHQCPNCH